MNRQIEHNAVQRRINSTRYKTRKQNRPCLVVTRSAKHISAQVIVNDGMSSRVIAAMSSVSKELRSYKSDEGKIGTAKQVGKLLAELTQSAGIKAVCFDRRGHKYHGRIKALADAARAAGLDF